jgi:hypothetical protein
MTNQSPIDEVLESTGMTRRSAMGRTFAGVATVFLCKLPVTGGGRTAKVAAEAITYRGFQVRLTHHGPHAMIALRRKGERVWREMDHMVFMRMDDGTYVSCLYCTAAAYTKPRALIERLIDDHHLGLFNLVA